MNKNKMGLHPLSETIARGAAGWALDRAAAPYVAAGHAEWRGQAETEFDRLYCEPAVMAAIEAAFLKLTSRRRGGDKNEHQHRDHPVV